MPSCFLQNTITIVIVIKWINWSQILQCLVPSHHFTSYDFLTQVHFHQLCRRAGPACTPLQHHQCSLTPVPGQLKWGHLSAAFMKTYGGICPLVPHRICDIEPRHCPGKAYCMSKKQIPKMSHSRGPLGYHPPKHASKSISKPCTISLVINCFCAACQEFRNFTAKKRLGSLASAHLVLKLLGQLCLRVVLKVAQHLLPRNLKWWEVRHQRRQLCLLSAFDLFQSRPETSASYQVHPSVKNRHVQLVSANGCLLMAVDLSIAAWHHFSWSLMGHKT